jgi:hypothetical protein
MNTEQLKEFLFNAEAEMKLDVVPLSHFVEAMKTLGFPEENYELETMGWESDFWLDYKKDNYPYKVTFSGSLFYGSYKVSKEFIA